MLTNYFFHIKTTASLSVNSFIFFLDPIKVKLQPLEMKTHFAKTFSDYASLDSNFWNSVCTTLEVQFIFVLNSIHVNHFLIRV